MTTTNTELVELMARAMEPLVNDDMDETIREAWLTDLALAALEAVRPMLEERERLRSALMRLNHNFDLLLRGKPVRDVAETLAETFAALNAGVEEG